jgi:hypothetical protein
MLVLFRWMKGTNPTRERFAWGVAGGSLTGCQNFLKDSLTVFKDVRKHHGNHQLYPWWWFLLLSLAVSTAFGGLLILTACMKRYDVTYSSAMFVGSFVVSASLMSVVHYDTLYHLTSIASCIMYPIGLLVLMTGVWMLVHGAVENSYVSLELVLEEVNDIVGTRDQVIVSDLLLDPLLDEISDDEGEAVR